MARAQEGAKSAPSEHLKELQDALAAERPAMEERFRAWARDLRVVRWQRGSSGSS